jgi:hypothetical protein
MASSTSQEIIHSLVEFKSETIAALSTLATKIDGINRRLDVSNGRLAQHEEALQELRVRESQMRIRLRHVEEESQGRQVTRRSFRMAMFERLLWLVGATLLAVIVHSLKL